jgi:hypothetical protein
MNAVQIDIDSACGDNMPAAASAASLEVHGLRLLSQQEVGAVAGGPEADVGSGVTPP